MIALLGLFIQYLPALIKAGADVYAYVTKVRQIAQQQGMWSDEQEAAFTAELEKLKSNPPAWWIADE